MDEREKDNLDPAAPLEEETFAFPFLKDESLKSKQIGPYELLEVLGEGGQGVVYLAEQHEPIERRVALKVIKLGMDSKQVISRFESERQALALMNHPHVAKVLDAGTTKEGRPYFVMEYVEGTSITTYCDRQRLGARERLELMLPVCQAVHHAHQKGIIHRDLKPSNILVSVEDGRPQPKVIDFGVAKATQHRLTEKTLVTQQGFRLGTPGYMSPEQAEITGLDIDTTTDVYSLGVVLYSLLTGVLPFDPERLREGGYSEMQRIIREEEPMKPSTRVSALGEKAADIARARQTDTRSLTKHLCGDLDWITLKCLEKDRTRRYQSVNALALDIERHLKDEPVLASPPSKAYRMKKFVRRHRVGVAAGALVVLALTLGIAGTTIGMIRANREAAAAQQVSDFLVELFEVSDPAEAKGETITAREMLDRGAERLREELVDQPLIRARLMGTIGMVYRELGLYQNAAPLLLEALSIREDLLGPDHRDVAPSLYGLAINYRKQGKYEEAESLLIRSLEINERAYGSEHPDVATALNSLGNLYGDLGKYEEEAQLHLRSLEINEKVLGPDHPDVAMDLMNLGGLYRRLGKYEEAEPLLIRSLQIKEKAHGPDDPSVASVLMNLGNLYLTQGKYEEAEPLYIRSLEIKEKVLGPDHPSVALTLLNLASLYRRLGKYEEAEPLYIRSLEINEKAVGPDHPDVATDLMNLGILYATQGKYAAAEPLFIRSLEIKEKVLSPDHPEVANSLGNLAELYAEQGKYEEAEPLYIRSLEISEKVLGPDHPDVAYALHGLGTAYRDQRRYSEAEPLYERALAIWEKSLEPDQRDFVRLREDYAKLLRATGREKEAEDLEARVSSTQGESDEGEQ